ncbi:MULTISPECIES: 2,4'-dihydroxyacetophenone dioxygenase family protein [Pseudonocardia]|uniref:ChrR-like protein with cupin domain n=1 Tax=Pseudonocardia kunmingensis TaxID=630975 RepID=A0A543DVN2_9PSEU|nr:MULTISPECIES: 2,4'-dihydroxyacetophenone dioxygenase family protein [Pseudonocardia]TQM13359.1 ChrR-like protein with cupin domain [Pseudonocardia kunmingensis]
MSTVETRSVTDLLVQTEQIPWVPQGENIWFKPVRLSPSSSTWVNLLKVTKSGRISRHRHLGAVEAWVIKGSWRYLEHDWVAHAGDFVFEGRGDVHTLVTDGADEMITLFNIHGPIEYLDDDDRVLRTETPETKLALYEDFCRREGLKLAPVVFSRD